MFKGLAGLGDMARLMKQAQQMQEELARVQESLETIEVTGEAGAGLVKVRCNAKGRVTGVEIDPTIFSADEKEVVEDLITAAVRDAQERAAARAQEEMARVTEGLQLPPGMKLPF